MGNNPTFEDLEALFNYNYTREDAMTMPEFTN
jgi:hypothetical protein